MSAAMDVKLKHLVADKDRHGNVRYYVRLPGEKKVRVRGEPGSAAFLEAYQSAVLSLPSAGPKQGLGSAHGTLAWLGQEYFGSTAFKRLEASTRTQRRRILEGVFQEPRKPGSPEVFGQCPAGRFTADHAAMLRDRKAETPAAANNMLKWLSAMFSWAVKNRKDVVKTHPLRDVEKVRYRVKGHYAWEIEDVAQFVERHPLGTMAHLAVGLMLFTGARRVDAYQLGRQHVRNGWLKFTPQKTRNSTGMVLDLPVLPTLERIIAASPYGDLTFLQNGWNRPFASAAAFGNWFKDRCHEAGLPQCTPHGLRKAGATILAEAGASEHDLMAVFGWSSVEEALVYTRAANRKKMAARAMPLLEAGWIGNAKSPTGPNMLSHREAEG